MTDMATTAAAGSAACLEKPDCIRPRTRASNIRAIKARLDYHPMDRHIDTGPGTLYGP